MDEVIDVTDEIVAIEVAEENWFKFEPEFSDNGELKLKLWNKDDIMT